MNRRSLLILSLAILLTLAPTYGATIFSDADLTISPVTVTFNQFSGNLILSNVPVEVYGFNGLTVNMANSDYQPGSNYYSTLNYGIEVMADGYNTNASSPYLLNTMTTSPSSPQQGVEFILAGGTVSSIGIRLAASSITTTNPIVIQILDSSLSVIDSFQIMGAQLTAIKSGGNVDPNGTNSGFFGFANATADITGFRVVGGLVAMDDLKFGGVTLSTDPGPGPDPEPVPEASTFLLCGTALGLLSLGGRLRRRLVASVR